MKKLFAIFMVSVVSACTYLTPDEDKFRPQEFGVVETGLNFSETSNYYVPSYGSKMYSVVASRATNKMLKERQNLYKKSPSPKIYVMQVKKVGVSHVPDGFYHARNKTKDIIKDSQVFEVVNAIGDANYVLETQVSSIDVPNLQGGLLQYKLILLDKNNKEVAFWVENIRQVQNDDRSWW